MSRFPLLHSALIASFVLASACDGVVHESPVEPVAHTPARAPIQPKFTGQVVLDSDDFAPVSAAQVIVELTAADGSELESIELATDADGHFALETVPEGVVSITSHVFVGGEFAGSETVAVINGEPVKKAVVVIALTAVTICIATTWASARKIAGSDKMKHCVASCRTARWCGVGSAFSAAILKELLDSLCMHGPQWLKNLLQPVSACGGWDSADMAANNRGISCAGKWRTCENCCDDYY